MLVSKYKFNSILNLFTVVEMEKKNSNRLNIRKDNIIVPRKIFTSKILSGTVSLPQPPCRRPYHETSRGQDRQNQDKKPSKTSYDQDRF